MQALGGAVGDMFTSRIMFVHKMRYRRDNHGHRHRPTYLVEPHCRFGEYPVRAYPTKVGCKLQGFDGVPMDITGDPTRNGQLAVTIENNSTRSMGLDKEGASGTKQLLTIPCYQEQSRPEQQPPSMKRTSL